MRGNEEGTAIGDGAAAADGRFVDELSRRLRSSFLNSEPALDEAALGEAARFVLAAASIRPPGGEAVIVVDSVGGPIGTRMTRIAAINDDMPFLVDSIALTISSFGLTVNRLLHPVVAARRDPNGRLIGLPGNGDDEALAESMIYIETDRADARTRAQLRMALGATLADVHAAVGDWPRLRAQMGADADALARLDPDAREEAALLRWLNDHNFTQLGHVVRHRDGSQTDAAGICRSSATVLLSDKSYARAFDRLSDESAGGPLLILKSNLIGQVHRRVPLDLFIVPRFEGKEVAALSVHVGVWTSAALAATPKEVPLLRRALAAIMERLELDPQGHAGKSLTHVLTTLPQDVLIGLEPVELERIAITMMSLIDRPRPHLALVQSVLQRHLFGFVWLPRDDLSTAIRLQIQAMVAEAAEAKLLDWSLEVDGALATIRMVLDIRNGADPIDETALAAQLTGLVRGWAEAVEIALMEGEGAAGGRPGRALAIAERFADAFPLSYRNTYGAAEAAEDIRRLLRLGDGIGAPARGARLHCLGVCPEGQLRLKLYQHHGLLRLSDAVPMLEHFGFRVVGEVATLLEDGALGAIHDFLLELPAGPTSDDLLARSPELEAAIAAVINGLAEDDGFNRLITASGLAAHEADWLRAMYRFLRQTGMTYATTTVVDALQAAPRVTQGLVKLFIARHDPAFEGDRTAGADEAAALIREGLAGVSAINDDRLLRRYHALIEAVLRTNAFAPAKPSEPETALALKIDSGAVPDLPAPVPWREIFVHSRRVEGVHLRAGPIARGGLRWSDRRDDFRTETLGLMKAQRVKNAVIVPTGAKGGFYPKRLPDPALDREGWLAEGRESYQIFIRSLLSLTDNIVDGKVVHPDGVVIRDGDDPYFVVAADKGTASFSDTANAIAATRDFWLDDAFASGGSKGYDHKAMGITARGAWLSVQRHFLERGVDVQTQSVRVAGCGDMSGDVFGNGMLRSQAIKLVAAFDHRHIFIDPEPDPQASWAERKRLFELPRSSWDDYDRALISRGGGVFSRSLKTIELSEEARAVLGVAEDSLDPERLIAAVLQSPVDLLWFGGIGTYVKASAESNATVGDPANDAVRVDAAELRATVVGEGANLACTQAGRIEFALRGGRINADFIDNSAGVASSDKEVNIKIALASARRAGRLDEEARVALLGEMTGDVASLVLEDNRLQALALSIAEAGGAGAMPSYLRLIEVLEMVGQIDRRSDGIADAATLSRRAADGQGLTRPELAVLLSSGKLALQSSLQRAPFPDDPLLDAELFAAFPPAMQERFREDILDHRLRQEIIATRLANRMLNRMGLIHGYELTEEEGATADQLATTLVAAEQLFGMGAVWDALDTAPMPEAARILLLERAAAALRLHIADLLRAGGGRLAPAQLVDELQEGIAELVRVADEKLGQELRHQSQQLRAEFAAAGAPPAEAAMVAHLFDLDGAAGLSRLSRETGFPAPQLVDGFVDIGAALGLDWAQGKATRMNPNDPWERLLVGGLARDFQQMRLDFLTRAAAGGGDPRQAVARWTADQRAAIAQFRASVGRAQAALQVTPSMLAQLASQARSLLVR